MEISTDVGAEAPSAADQLRLEGKKEIIVNLIKLGEMSLEKIAQVAKVDLATIKEIHKELD